jgi:hypothetical protein
MLRASFVFCAAIALAASACAAAGARHPDDVVIAVFSGFDDRAHAQQQTWVRTAREHNITVVYMGPGEDRTLPFLRLGAGRCPSMISKCASHSGTEQTVKMWARLLGMFPRAKLFFKCDDDTAVRIPELCDRVLAPLLLQWEDRAVIGQCERHRVKSLTNPKAYVFNKYDFFCGGGAGSVMTRAAVGLVVDGWKQCPDKAAPDDVFVATCAAHHGARLVYNPGFNEEWPATDDWITQHHVTPTKMLQLFRLE